MTYISVTLCADLRAGSAAVWHGAGAVQPEGDMTPADFAPFNIIRIMRSTCSRAYPLFRWGKTECAGGEGSSIFQGPAPHPPENRPQLYPAYTQV